MYTFSMLVQGLPQQTCTLHGEAFPFDATCLLNLMNRE